jgi:hypothetical protein
VYTWKQTIGIAVSLWLGASMLDLPNFLDWGDHTYDMKTMACSYDRLASYSYTVFFITMFVTVSAAALIVLCVFIGAMLSSCSAYLAPWRLVLKGSSSPCS